MWRQTSENSHTPRTEAAFATDRPTALLNAWSRLSALSLAHQHRFPGKQDFVNIQHVVNREGWARKADWSWAEDANFAPQYSPQDFFR